MTLTLPSEFHKMEMDKKTKALIANPKYNLITPKDAVKHLTYTMLDIDSFVISKINSTKV